MGFKLDNGGYDDSCLAKARPGTPIFVLVATDESMADTIEDWIRRNPQASIDKLMEAYGHIEVVKKWQAEHPELVKAAD